jgi:hypothetical protein
MSNERQKASRTGDRSSLRLHPEGSRWNDKLRQALPRDLGREVGILYSSAARTIRSAGTERRLERCVLIPQVFLRHGWWLDSRQSQAGTVPRVSGHELPKHREKT